MNQSLDYSSQRRVEKHPSNETCSSKRSHTDGSKPCKRNLTLTVVSISFLFMAGTLPWAIYVVFSDIGKTSNAFLDVLSYIAVSCLFLLIACKIFIYSMFNRFYRLILKKYFKIMFKCIL